MSDSVYWYECLAEPEKTTTRNIAAVYNFALVDFVERSQVRDWWVAYGGTVGTARWDRFLAGWQLTEGVIPDGGGGEVEVYFLGNLFWLDVIVTVYDTLPADRECPIIQYGFP